MTGYRKHYWVFGVILVAAISALTNYHWQKIGLPYDWRMTINLISFGWLVSLIAMAHMNPTYQATRREVEALKTVVVVPVYNEDPITFRAMLDSLDKQSRVPDALVIVDDGSQSDACRVAYDSWRQTTTIRCKYIYQDNNGKREAQAQAFRISPGADVYVTLDSDTVLDTQAIENGLKPFARAKVMAVAGLLLGLNDRANLLTRLVDIGFVTSFVNGRAAWSQMHSVAVNCGGLAFYRSNVVRKYMDEYLNHTVFGIRSTCGDDRMLTNFALLEGWTVFQENSVGYTLLPVNFKHLTKQRIRWWRSFFWGGEWLIRRFPMNRLVWWLVAWQFICFGLYTVMIPAILLFSPVVHHSLPVIFFAYIFVLGYVRNIRYLSIKRSDQSFASQLLTYALSPLSTLLHMYLCTVLQYVGLCTMKQMGWSTRAKVEVGISGS